APGEGGDRDVIWGPKPRMLSERYLGGRRCWKINWRVEVAVLDQCFTNKAFSGRAMEFNYSVTPTIATTGLSTISSHGHFPLPPRPTPLRHQRPLPNPPGGGKEDGPPPQAHPPPRPGQDPPAALAAVPPCRPQLCPVRGQMHAELHDHRFRAPVVVAAAARA